MVWNRTKSRIYYNCKEQTRAISKQQTRDVSIMGVIDNDILQDINKSIKTLLEYTRWDYTFKTDDGDYETAIEFTAIGYRHPPQSKNWDEMKADGNTMVCPDLLDYTHKLIIEYEEEPKPGKRGGKLGKKGHTSESDRDEHRDQLYRIAGFKLLKIWEIEYLSNSYKEKLYKFLHEM